MGVRRDGCRPPPVPPSPFKIEGRKLLEKGHSLEYPATPAGCTPARKWNLDFETLIEHPLAIRTMNPL